MDKQTIRPALPLMNDVQDSPPLKFQNAVLRPILKLQNDLLVAAFQDYLSKRKQRFDQKSTSDQKAYIKHVLQTDQRFKQYLLGMVVGMFTIEEWQIYQAHQSEICRRIWTMIAERLIDNLVEEIPLF